MGRIVNGFSFAGSSGGAAPASLPLDGTTSSVLAFSVAYKLRTDYTGNCIRVRRSSDDTEQDIGFSGDQLDTAALLAFCGAGNGFIRKVYEQSGHASAVDYGQDTASLHPQIVASGSVITKDGHVAMRQPTTGAGIEYVTLDGWTPRPASAIGIEVWSSPAGRDQMSIVGGNNAVFSLCCQDGSTSTAVSAEGGASTFHKNGSLATTTTRDDAHAAFNTDALNVVRHNGLDFTANSNWQFLRTAYTSSTGFDGPEYWSSQIIYTDTGETSTIEGRVADLYGITLS